LGKISNQRKDYIEDENNDSYLINHWYALQDISTKSYVMINNYSCIFTNRMQRSNFYVYGLYANLYFGNDKDEFALKSQNSKIILYHRKSSSFKSYKKWEKVYLGTFDIDDYVELRDFSAKNIASKIFYTIVTNYAMLSLIPSSYYAACSELILEKGKWTKKLDNFSGHSWIQRIFGLCRSLIRG